MDGPRRMRDAFSKCHPAVNFLFFVGAIGMSVVIQHPAYLAAGFVGGITYYLLLNGRKGVKNREKLLFSPVSFSLVKIFLHTFLYSLYSFTFLTNCLRFLLSILSKSLLTNP